MDYKITVSRLAALAHEGRLDLFRRLVQAGPDGLAAGTLAKEADINFTTASAQLNVLSNAQLVKSSRDGRSVIYRANYDTIRLLIGFMMEDCCQGRSEILSPLKSIFDASLTCCATPKGAPS